MPSQAQAAPVLISFFRRNNGNTFVLSFIQLTSVPGSAPEGNVIGIMETDPSAK
jgi:hypothetical protein